MKYSHNIPSINLENVDYKEKKMIINSPRSIFILQQNDICIDDLYFYDFNEYREMNPEIKSLNIELQYSHYLKDKNMREVLREKLIKERRNLIETLNKKNQEKKEESFLIPEKKLISNKKSGKKKEKETKTLEEQKKELIQQLTVNLREAYLQGEEKLKSQFEKISKNEALLLDWENSRKEEENRHKKCLEKEKI